MCVRPDDAYRQAILCRDGNGPRSRKGCGTSSWAGPIPPGRPGQQGLLDGLKKALAERVPKAEVGYHLRPASPARW